MVIYTATFPRYIRKHKIRLHKYLAIYNIKMLKNGIIIFGLTLLYLCIYMHYWHKSYVVEIPADIQ